jgi:hypothetical protein
MLSKIKSLHGYKLNSLDGEIGKAKEFYFDDCHWTIRYLVADTGNWLTGRKVLISPYALMAINPVEQNFVLNLTKDQIQKSPSLNSDKPVSKQFEQEYNGYYGWPNYWSGPYPWGQYTYVIRNRDQWNNANKNEKTWDPHLRSTNAVTGYHIHALDGDVGNVDDFIIDDETWTIRYLVVNTSNWWGGKKVLVSPLWIGRVSWSESSIFINLSRDAIKRSPEYTYESLVTRDYEMSLHQHYNRKGHWVNDLATA